MTRLNRQQRRAMKHRPRGYEAKITHLDEMIAQVAILPGLPGSLYDYVPQAEKDEILEAEATEHLDAIAELHPGMMWRAMAVSRAVPLGIPEVPPVRLRHVKAAAPGGLGEGVVLGEFTTEPERPRSRLILPGRDGSLMQIDHGVYGKKPADNRAAALKFLQEFRDG